MKEAFEKAVDLLSRREHSEKEIRQKLRLRGFEKQDIETVVLKLVEYRYLSNERYARMLFQIYKKKGFGLKKIQLKFQQKGLKWTPEIQDLELEYSQSGLDEETMDQWLEKKARFLKEDMNSQKSYEKLLSFLIQKGFAYDKAQKSVKNFIKNKKEGNA